MRCLPLFCVLLLSSIDVWDFAFLFFSEELAFICFLIQYTPARPFEVILLFKREAAN